MFDLQFVFCRNSNGKVSFDETFQRQPPLGILTIASFLKSKLPDLKVEVIDGNYYSDKEIIEKINSKVIGFSCWYSNYLNSLSIAKQLKELHTGIKIIFGGPYISCVGRNILHQNLFIDYIAIGEGELSLYQLLTGVSIENIRGLYNRNHIIDNGRIEFADSIELNSLPNVDLSLLSNSYSWMQEKSFASMSSFPLSGIRGCIHSNNRCHYCSIPFKGYRITSGEKYWSQISQLYHNYSINHYFETGDIFSVNFVNNLIKTRPQIDVAFRIYGYLGLFNQNNKEKLRRIGVKNLYIGIESILHLDNRNFRRYKSQYSVKNIKNEINEYGKEGINVIPGFLIGLPGENHASLEQNIEMIEEITSLSNVAEASINIVLPLPGSAYFKQILSNKNINMEYYSITGSLLSESDYFDFTVLSQLFTKYYTNVNYQELETVINKFENTLGECMTNWNKIAI